MAIDLPPFGVFKLPINMYGGSQPVAEHEVELTAKPKAPKKSTERPYSARPIIPSLAFDGRGFQSINPPQPREENEFDLRRYGISNGTGKGYEGTFAGQPVSEEQPAPVKEADGLLPRRTIDGGRPASTKESFLSRLIAPSEDELEAARNGMRWYWALEHRWMLPGSKWNETVWNGVDRENMYLRSLLKQSSSSDPNKLDVGMPTAATIRARENLRGRIMNQYDKALAEYMKGHWDDPERAYNDFKAEVERLREQYRKAGTEYGGAFDPEDLRLPPPIAAPRNAFTTQVKPFTLAKQWDYAKSVNDKLGEWIASGKINDPKFMGSSEAQTYLDSVYETLIKYIKESANAMADAEKQRLQILVLPDSAHDEVVGAIQDFQKALAGVMSSASAKDWSQNNRGKVNEILKDFGFNAEETDKEGLAAMVEGGMGTLMKALANKDELPHDVATDLEAIKMQFDTYMKNMMLAANVAPHLVANMAKTLADFNANAYNDQAFKAGRARADFLGDLEDLTDKIPLDAMPMSKLIERPKYIWPSLNKRGKAKTTANPQTGAEGNEVTIDSDSGEIL